MAATGAHSLSERRLSVGDYIVLSSSSGCEYGYIKWLGNLPELGDELFAGIEFKNQIGYGTGDFFGQRLFQADWGHASLVPAMNLERAEDLHSKAVRSDSLPSVDLATLRIGPSPPLPPKSLTAKAGKASRQDSRNQSLPAASLPATISSLRTPFGRWISSESLVLTESFSATRTAGCFPCYLCRDLPLQSGLTSSICFEVLDLSTKFGGILCFGVASVPITEDSIKDLLVIPVMLMFSKEEKSRWFTSSIYVRKGEKVRILRSESAVMVVRQDKFTENSLAFDLDREAVVYPFFCFTGAVTSIRLLNHNMESMPKWAPVAKPRQSKAVPESEPKRKVEAEGFECGICKDKPRAYMCSPCNHVEYCEECMLGLCVYSIASGKQVKLQRRCFAIKSLSLLAGELLFYN